MQIKLSDIVGNIENIKSLLTCKLPIKIAYKLNKLSNKLDRELIYYSEIKNKLIIELGEKQENGDIKIVDPVKIKEFEEKHQEILSADVELDFEKIKVEDLGDIVVSPNELVNWIFE